MTVSTDLRWRAIVLTYVYDIDVSVVAPVLGVSIRSVERWYQLFKSNGNVLPKQPDTKSARWPDSCVDFVRQYVNEHPCFYLEELQEAVKKKYPALANVVELALRHSFNTLL